jgi:hypothetical protein
MEFTLAELLIIIFAFILLTYYLFSINQCKKSIENDDDNNNNNNDDDDDQINMGNLIENMAGNINESIPLINMNSNSNIDGYNSFKKILDINQYKSLNSLNNLNSLNVSNIELWIPFFAIDLKVSSQDIIKAKELKDPENIFLQLLYPKILIKSLDLIRKFEDLKLYFSQQKIIQNSFDIYINYIKEYNIYYVNMKFNLINKQSLLELKKQEDKLIQIHNLLLNSLK